jgi:hypothetical protein
MFMGVHLSDSERSVSAILERLTSGGCRIT